MTRRSELLAVGFLALVLVYGGLAFLWTDTSSAWYRELEKPAFQPPDAVFGIIWPLNYLALAVVGVAVSRTHPDQARRMLGVFAASVVLALGWSYTFGQAELLVVPAVCLALAALLTWVLLAQAGRARPLYGLLLVVYACWMTLATALSVTLALTN